jgi:hypothetical protein
MGIKKANWHKARQLKKGLMMDFKILMNEV